MVTDHLLADKRTDSRELLIPDPNLLNLQDEPINESSSFIQLGPITSSSADNTRSHQEPTTTDNPPLTTSMDSFKTLPSSVSDNQTTNTAMHTSSYSRATNCKLRLFAVIITTIMAFAGVFMAVGTYLILAARDSPNGNIVLGTSDVRLLLTLNALDIHQVTLTLNGTEDNFTAVFYQSECSDIETERQSINRTKFLAVMEQQYRIDELYLIKHSVIQYFFTAPELQDSSSCVAMIHIFSDHLNYFQFISTGQVHEAISHCLSPQITLNFTLSVSAVEEDQYYFVGLESFANTTITYTAIHEQLNYNSTGLFPMSRTFLATDCSISLSGDEDVCILAQLQDTSTFVTINYTTQYTAGCIWLLQGGYFMGVQCYFFFQYSVVLYCFIYMSISTTSTKLITLKLLIIINYLLSTPSTPDYMSIAILEPRAGGWG